MIRKEILRSELIKELQEQNEKYGDGSIYVALTVDKMVRGISIKSVGLDANNSTVIDIECSMSVQVGDKIKLTYVDGVGKPENCEIKVISKIEQYNEKLYEVNFEDTQGNFIFSLRELMNMKKDALL